MKVASLAELKKEINQIGKAQLVEICIALVKYKKDNKELVDYLLFESYDMHGFVASIKIEIDSQFGELKANGNLNNIKKTLRKILRNINKYCKYLNDKAIAAELHIYFCSSLKKSTIPYYKNQLIKNLYAQQLKKINILISSLHPDLHQNYTTDLESL